MAAAHAVLRHDMVLNGLQEPAMRRQLLQEAVFVGLAIFRVWLSDDEGALMSVKPRNMLGWRGWYRCLATASAECGFNVIVGGTGGGPLRELGRW
jgi:hypothetical protein